MNDSVDIQDVESNKSGRLSYVFSQPFTCTHKMYGPRPQITLGCSTGRGGSTQIPSLALPVGLAHARDSTQTLDDGRSLHH